MNSFWQGTINDCPWDLVVAVNQALMVISWFENLPKDEQPPRHIWWSDKLLDEWFRDVQDRREERYGSKKRTSYEEATDVPMVENEFAASLRPNRGR